MGRIVLISDNLLTFCGGAEYNDKILQEELQCEFVTTSVFNQTLSRFNNADFFVLSNHYDIDEDAADFLCERRFCHISHDMLLTHSRNPLVFENGIIPENQLRNKKLFEKSAVIVVQSTLHEDIFKNNLAANYYNLKGNLWSDKDFALMEGLRGKRKNGRAFVIDNPNPIKGTALSERFCRAEEMPFDKIGSMDYYSFLDKLSDYSVYVGLAAGCFESFGRIHCESEMMGVNAVGNDLVGFLSDYSGVSGGGLLEIMKGKKKELVNLIRSYL